MRLTRAVELVRSEGRGLHGLVNNAGVNVVGPMIELDESEMRFLFDVNIYGPYRVTKAFAPLIIESQGRINNVSSISGVLTAATLWCLRNEQARSGGLHRRARD